MIDAYVASFIASSPKLWFEPTKRDFVKQVLRGTYIKTISGHVDSIYVYKNNRFYTLMTHGEKQHLDKAVIYISATYAPKGDLRNKNLRMPARVV
jgi:hypothetical protein